jgi:uncharacterized phage protein (TIGR02218 family)
VIGFTDHDDDVAFDGVDHLATAGFSASADVAHASFAVGGLDLEGAFSSDSLVDVELMAGDYDGAVVELWLVNWQAVDERVLIRRGILGEVTKADEAFRAEVRGPMQALEAIKGRVFTAACDADLGDARCGVDLADPAFRGEGTVAEAFGPRRLRAGGLGGFDAGWFDGGLLTFTGGANAGRRFLVKRHAVEALGVFLDLAGEPPQPIEVDDPFEVTAGCDKRFPTCGEKFENMPNFRGFPHIPGNDVVLNVARSTDRNEGRRLR